MWTIVSLSEMKYYVENVAFANTYSENQFLLKCIRVVWHMGGVHTTGMHWDKETGRELGIILTIACSLMEKEAHLNILLQRVLIT